MVRVSMAQRDWMKSKNTLACELLDMIRPLTGGVPHKSDYGDGCLNKQELYVVHQFVKKVVEKR